MPPFAIVCLVQACHVVKRVCTAHVHSTAWHCFVAANAPLQRNPSAPVDMDALLAVLQHPDSAYN